MILLFLMLMLWLPRPVSAAGPDVSYASAHPTFNAIIEDDRAARLTTYLLSHGSPLAPESSYFIAEADRLGLDWKLVAAIAGVESTFGKRIPHNSYNAWGWAIYTGQSDGRHFVNWKEGITVVSEGLKYRYIDRGAVTIEQIGRIYAASPTWSSKVRFFLAKIEDFTPTSVEHLSVTI